MKIIVGSSALRYHGVDLRDDRMVDMDVVVPLNSLTSEVELGYIKEDPISLPIEIIMMIPYCSSGIRKIATIDAVYTLKLSHLAFDIKWQKHKSDVLRLKKLGAKKIVKLYDDLLAYWEYSNTDKDRLNLYKKKSDFFDDYVEYVYDHDFLHEVVAFPDKPIYSLCLVDGQEVAIDKEKFFKLPLDKQLRMFQEEVTVIAAERWLIPKRKRKIHWRKAYSLAVHKTITSLTKGWASQFMIDNLEFYIRPDFNLIKKLYDKGIIEMEELLTDEEKTALFLDINKNFYEFSGDGGYDFPEILLDFSDFKNGEKEFKAIERRGGEGEGEHAHTIFFWDGIYYRFDYAYYSYDGFDFDYMEGRIVTPVEETVIVYK